MITILKTFENCSIKLTFTSIIKQDVLTIVISEIIHCSNSFATFR